MTTTTDDRYKRFDDILTVRKLFRMESIHDELELMNTKWFDYRFVNPLDATLLFAKAYIEEYKRIFARDIDVNKAKNVKGINIHKFLSNPQERTQTWLARQRADKVGMPYEIYIALSMKFAFKRQRSTIPRPNQLHHSNCSNVWNSHRSEKWQEYLNAMQPVAVHPAYRVENYRGLRAQDDYRQFILDRSLSSSGPLSSHMERYSFDLEQIELEAFRGIFPADRYDEALEQFEFERSIGGTPVPATPSVTLIDLWPSCFGLSAASEPTSCECSSCSEAERCARMSDIVTRQLVKVTGSASPVEDHVRELARERKKRSRSNKQQSVFQLNQVRPV